MVTAKDEFHDLNIALKRAHKLFELETKRRYIAEKASLEIEQHHQKRALKLLDDQIAESKKLIIAAKQDLEAFKLAESDHKKVLEQLHETISSGKSLFDDTIYAKKMPHLELVVSHILREGLIPALEEREKVEVKEREAVKKVDLKEQAKEAKQEEKLSERVMKYENFIKQAAEKLGLIEKKEEPKVKAILKPQPQQAGHSIAVAGVAVLVFVALIFLWPGVGFPGSSNDQLPMKDFDIARCINVADYYRNGWPLEDKEYLIKNQGGTFKTSDGDWLTVGIENKKIKSLRFQTDSNAKVYINCNIFKDNEGHIIIDIARVKRVSSGLAKGNSYYEYFYVFRYEKDVVTILKYDYLDPEAIDGVKDRIIGSSIDIYKGGKFVESNIEEAERESTKKKIDERLQSFGKDLGKKSVEAFNEANNKLNEPSGSE
ncbi:hypothetical protein ACFL0W_00840 [Nanoarchaeota archaeon]